MIDRAGAGLACLLIALYSIAARAQQGQSPEASPQPEESPAARFEGKPHWELLIGPFAFHWHNNDKYKHVYLLGIERSCPEQPLWSHSDATLWGFSAFKNSYGQPSAYAYYGYRWDNLFGYPALYAKLTGGIIYGYKYPYEDKVPFNHNGFGLAIIPSLGYRVTPFDAVQINVLGAAGLIFTYHRRF